jgi:hypothetical protein
LRPLYLLLYKEALPERFIIVPHNKKTVGAIRNFIHADQAERQFAVLILDDDITGIYKNEGEESNFDNPKTINDLINDINAVGEADLIVSLFSDYKCPIDNDNKFHKPLAVGYVMFPHMTHIKMNESEWENEDWDGYIKFRTAKANRKGVLYSLTHYYADVNSSFSMEWRIISKVKLYEKYGCIFDLGMFPPHDLINYRIKLTLTEDFDFINKYGVKYTQEGNESLKKIIELYSDNEIIKEQLDIIWQNIKDKPLITENEKADLHGDLFIF